MERSRPSGVSQAASFAGVGMAVSQFTPDTVTTIQCRVLNALGRHRSPESLTLLVQVANTQTQKPKPSSIEPAGGLGLELTAGISEPDRIDVRLAAIRASVSTTRTRQRFALSSAS